VAIVGVREMWRPRVQGGQASHGASGVEGKAIHGVVLLMGGLLFLPPPGKAASAFPVEATVYFSPHGSATDAIVRELGSAQLRIVVQAYSFTSAPITKAILDAHKRGVPILVVLDKSNQTDKYSAATFLENAGIAVLIDAAHAIAHNKVFVIETAPCSPARSTFPQPPKKRMRRTCWC
jgi:phosphatidylserine/phosphatidylglycerophosphate/cardiolipin synthase-like enzyme